jgi:hypothetical protein
VVVSPELATVTLATPEGGLEGVSVADLAGSGGAAFEAIYNDADWDKAATVRFTGGRVDSRTGKDLPNARTGVFRVARGEQAEIEWDNATMVDWESYAVFLSPALKQ